MCGIVGVASRVGLSTRQSLVTACECIAHRGPDDSGIWWSEDSRVGFGFRRLAIIDLSSAGHQPMRDSKQELTLVFNGEIYNYRELRALLLTRGHEFRSASDTEVILAAYREWGVDCLSHLNGMFALALYDSRVERLFLARDRAGEKPLFYSLSDGVLRFASELKALMADPAVGRRANREALDCFLYMGYVPGELCILDGFNKLPPAHALTFELASGKCRVWRYWDIPEYEGGAVDEAALLDELETLLQDAVGHQLVADVPVGILLSGGVDSSLVTAMAVRSSPHVKTFTVRFPGYGSHDETLHARLIADHFATEHIELEAQDITVDILPRLARQFDEPLIDSSQIPTSMLSELVRKHCTVALGGDGGDELFGGYPYYSSVRALERRQRFIPTPLRSALARAADRFLPVGFRGKNLLRLFGADLDAFLPAFSAQFDRDDRKALMRAIPDWPLAAEAVQSARTPAGSDIVQRLTRMDFENFLAEDILVKVDRASMMHSLEVRAPLLDRRVIEFAFGRVPSRLKATPDSRKVLLKRLCERVLPAGFDRTRKQGFMIPIGQWLKEGPWREFIFGVLRESTFLDRRMIEELISGQDQGRANGERLFGLTMLELWQREYNIDIS